MLGEDNRVSLVYVPAETSLSRDLQGRSWRACGGGALTAPHTTSSPARARVRRVPSQDRRGIIAFPSSSASCSTTDSASSSRPCASCRSSRPCSTADAGAASEPAKRIRRGAAHGANAARGNAHAKRRHAERAVRAVGRRSRCVRRLGRGDALDDGARAAPRRGNGALRGGAARARISGARAGADQGRATGGSAAAAHGAARARGRNVLAFRVRSSRRATRVPSMETSPR